LISVGVQGENNLAIWDIQTGLVVRSCLIKNTIAVNGISVDPYVGPAADLTLDPTSSQQHPSHI